MYYWTSRTVADVKGSKCLALQEVWKCHAWIESRGLIQADTTAISQFNRNAKKISRLTYLWTEIQRHPWPTWVKSPACHTRQWSTLCDHHCHCARTVPPLCVWESSLLHKEWICGSPLQYVSEHIQRYARNADVLGTEPHLPPAPNLPGILTMMDTMLI